MKVPEYFLSGGSVKRTLLSRDTEESVGRNILRRATEFALFLIESHIQNVKTL